MPLLSETRDKVKARLILSGSGEGGDPTNNNLTEAVRESYRELLALFALPQLATATVALHAPTNRYTASLTNVRLCHFVGHHQRILAPSVEYAWASPTLHFTPGIVTTGDTVWAWITPVIDLGAITIDTNVGTTCVHGPDWLEPAVIWRAEMLALSRMARPAGSTGAAAHGAHYRSLEPGYQALIKGMQAEQDEWLGSMRAALEMRLQLGDQPLIESPYATIRERTGGRRHNRAVGT